MKVFPEYFDPAQFFHSSQQRHTIKRPYLNFGKTLNIKFQDYNANLKLQCVYWHKLVMTCLNQYGMYELKKNIRCFEAQAYFEQCVQLNQWFAFHKKYYSHEYFYDRYFLADPHYDNI